MLHGLKLLVHLVLKVEGGCKPQGNADEAGADVGMSWMFAELLDAMMQSKNIRCVKACFWQYIGGR